MFASFLETNNCCFVGEHKIQSLLSHNYNQHNNLVFCNIWVSLYVVSSPHPFFCILYTEVLAGILQV